MSYKTLSDFPSHDEWLSYVHDHIAADEQAYVLACGRTDLFRNFYKVRNRFIPSELEQEFRSVQTLPEPERTDHLEELNKRIFADITSFLFDQVRPRLRAPDAVEPGSSRRQIEELRAYLIEKNRYFAVWAAYKGELKGQVPSSEWDQYVREQLGSGNKDDITFTHAMAELDKLLLYFRDRNAPLPRYFFERCWFLHHLRGRGENASDQSASEYVDLGDRWMRVRVISFGTNWWAMHSAEESDPYRFRRGAAYFNAAALMCGRRLHHSAVFSGQIRFNATSGFDPEFPRRAIGRTFLCSGPNQIAGKLHLLFERLAAKGSPEAYLATLNSTDHGVISFNRPGWKSPGVQPVSISLRCRRYEAMLLMGVADWISSDLGRWKVDAALNRLALVDCGGGVVP